MSLLFNFSIGLVKIQIFAGVPARKTGKRERKGLKRQGNRNGFY